MQKQYFQCKYVKLIFFQSIYFIEVLSMNETQKKKLEEKTEPITISIPRDILIKAKFCELNISRFCTKALQLETAQRLSYMIMYDQQNKYRYEQFAQKMYDHYQYKDAKKDKKKERRS